MMKRIGTFFKRMKNATAVPPILYFAILVFSIAAIWCGSQLCECKCVLGSVLSNLGFGIIGSLVVALLIDIASTKLKRRKDRENKRVMTSHYVNAFLDLRDCVLSIAEERYGDDGQKRTFDEWLEYVLADIEDGDDSLIDESVSLQISIDKIQKASINLYELLMLSLDNDEITEEYRNHVKTITSVASYIESLIKADKIQSAKRLILKTLVPKFLKYHENLDRYFNKAYCVSHYLEEEDE